MDDGEVTRPDLKGMVLEKNRPCLIFLFLGHIQLDGAFAHPNATFE